MAIVVRVQRDKMEAIVEVERQGDDALDVDAIRRALTDAGVTYGIDDKACSDLVHALNQAPSGTKISQPVAHGTLPIDGEDGRIELAVEYVRNPVGLLRESGSIDFHEHGSFTPIVVGQLIAKIALPTAGAPGSDVLGGPLKPNPGRRARFSAGAGTKLEAGGTELRATRHGDLRCTGELIEVLDVIRVPGNLDYAVGSIKCEGPVRIEGDVLPGFHIHAGGDVWVGGVVDAAEVTSGGAVTVAQGVLKGGCICANGKIMVGYAREAYLESNSNIVISKEALNSTVVCGDSIALPESGRVVGGRLIAQNRIEAGIAGHEKGIPTVLAAGVDALKELRRAKLAADIREADRVQTRVGKIKEVARPDNQAILDQLLARVATKQAGSADELAKLNRKKMELAHCQIKVKRRLHAGVRIRIGAEDLEIQDDLPGATFHYDAGSGQVVQV